MSRMRSVIRLFLASPTDVAKERATTETVVAEINRSIAPKLGLVVELVRWEDMMPGMGERPEQVILGQADIENSDAFVGILWNRFGTPTGRADSGTEEEFRVAYKTWQQGGKPRIMFYFCQRPTNLQTEQEIEQKARVIRFRQQISSLGIVREFQGPNEFEVLFRQDITNYLLSVRSDFLIEPLRHRLVQDIRLASSDLVPDRLEPAVREYREIDPSHMVRVPAGAFLAGRVPSKTTIDYDFYIDLTPVTNLDFVTFLEETGYMRVHIDPAVARVVEKIREEARECPDHPVTRVSWYDAIAYASWRGKRLPTAMEWEKAARGTDGRIFPWGNGFDSARCNCLDSGIGETTPVFKYEEGRSPYGCFDMAGNVFEWTNDWAKTPRFSSAPNSEKINRSGSYNRPAADLVCWYAESDPPASRMRDVGFRCVLVPEEGR